jgi:hypothetical protein
MHWQLAGSKTVSRLLLQGDSNIYTCTVVATDVFFSPNDDGPGKLAQIIYCCADSFAYIRGQKKKDFDRVGMSAAYLCWRPTMIGPLAPSATTSKLATITSSAVL